MRPFEGSQALSGSLILFRPKEIAKVIGELKPKKAPSGDLMLIELPKVICKLFNWIISLGYYPKKWENTYYHNDTEARKRLHNSVILQTNKFITVSV